MSSNASPSADATQAVYANGSTQPTIAFTGCKKEALNLNRGYKLLHRKLKQFANVELHKDEFSADKFTFYDIVVVAAPNEEITPQEFAELKTYMDRGGSVFLLLGEGHGGKYTHLNPMLAPLGIALNEDCVVRTVLHKYLHPKEVCVTNGVTNREINRAAGKVIIGGPQAPVQPGSFGSAASGGAGSNGSFGGRGGALASGKSVASVFGGSSSDATGGGSGAAANAAAPNSQQPTSLIFVYPHGSTLNVQRPAIPILSSGFMAYPLNRPVAAYYESPQLVHPAQINQQQQALIAANTGIVAPPNYMQPSAAQLGAMPPRRGKFLVMGSGLVFEDSWLPKEENDKLCNVLFDILLHKIKLNAIDADNPDITDYHYLPDTASLADRLRVAVEEPEELPRDAMSLFETAPFRFDTDMIPEVIQMYEHLNVKHEPLTLIHPEFQAPLPPCLPATFDPIHRELPPPALDLFDLDEQFSSERTRLSQLTNKCIADEDIEYFIAESAEIMGITKKLRSPRNKDPRALLDFVFRQLLQYKKNNPDVPLEPATSGGGAASGNPGKPGGLQRSNSGTQQQQQPAHANGGTMTRVLRVAGRPDGSCDLTPFERNAPWQLEMQVDFARGQLIGQLQLHRGDPNFPAQQVPVQGGVMQSGASAAAPGGASPTQLEWLATVVNVVGEQVRFVFRGTLAPAGGGHPGQQQLTGMVEFVGQSAQFMYVTEELA